MKKALLYLHIAVFLAGFTGVLGRLISLNESLLVWYRLLFTCLSMCGLFLWQRSFPVVSRTGLAKIFGVGAIVALHWVSFYGSIKYSNVSVALVCFSTLSFFSAILEPLVTRKKVSVAEVLLGLITILGVYLIFHFDAQYKKGILFGIVSAVLASLFTVLNKGLLARYQPRTVTFYELSGGFLVLSFILPFYLHLSRMPFSLPHGWDWPWLLFLSLVCTVLAFYLSLSALKSVSPFTVNLTYNLEPVYGIILAFLIYKENKNLHNSFYAGLLLIFTAVLIQMLRVYKKERRSALS
ncbi:MAG: DMT family transporter [Williamsia sp.]|nr:DMT family transporter [Williamsia sp.]